MMTLWLYCQGGFYQVAEPAMNFKNAQQVKNHYRANVVRAISMDRGTWLIDFELDKGAREQLARDHLEGEFMGWTEKKKRPSTTFRYGNKHYNRDSTLARYLGDKVPDVYKGRLR
jgi:hypothetical protein